MELTEVSILGLGAEGSIAFRALMGKPCRVRILARGQRAQRLKAEGIWVNGVHYDLHVAEPGAEPPPRLLIVAVKGYQREDALDDAAAETGPDTVVMSLMNGLTSEKVLARRIGADRLIYCMSRLNARKCGSHVKFQPVGDICIGERDGSVTDRIQEIHDLLDGVVSCRISREILLDIWRKYMFNAAFNTEESILRCRHRWFQQLPETGAALECIMEEIVRLANACGVALSEADIRALDGYFDRRSAGAGTQPRRRAAGMPVCLSSGQSHGAGKRLRSGDMVSCPSENVRAVFAVRKKKRRHGEGCAAAFPRSPADPAGKSLERICGGIVAKSRKAVYNAIRYGIMST